LSIKDRLYDKMQDEYDRMIEDMKSLPPEQIINRAYEKIAKEDLLACFGGEDMITDDMVQALYSLEYPLDELYQRWQDTDISFSDTFRDSVFDSVRELLSSADMEQTLLALDTEGLVLSDLLSFELADVHLCHIDEEHDLATVVELSNETLTKAGRQDWADVLNAEVKSIYNSDLGLTIDLSGVSAQRLTDFSYMLAGNVSVTDYNRWVAGEEEPENIVTAAPVNILPTSQAINGEIRKEDWVIAVPDDEYGCLVGMVTEITKHGTPEHAEEAQNETDNIHVDFTVVDYPPERLSEIEKYFSDLYGEPKKIDDLPLDDVIMAPDMLIRITGIHLDDLSRMVNDREAAEEFCGDYIQSRKKIERLRDELVERVNKNYSDYLESLQDFGKNEILDMVNKIKAVSDAWSYMTAWHEYDEHELGYLLEFQNPLEVLADEWRERCIDQSDMSFAMEYIYEHSDTLLEQYPVIYDADVSADKSLRRFMGVDLELYLGKIAEKTIIHYPNDWNIDMDAFRRIAVSDDPEEKRLIWHVCSTGTHLKNERDVFVRDSGAYAYMTDYHQNDPDMFGYFVEVTGRDRNGMVIGNIFEVGNYSDFAKHIRDTALPCDSVTLTYKDGSEKTLPVGQYDNDRAKFNTAKGYPLPEIGYNPADEAELTRFLRQERVKRMAYPIGSPGALLRKMADILKEVRKPAEELSPAEKPAEKPKSLEDKLKSAQKKADAHNAQNKKNKPIKKELD